MIFAAIADWADSKEFDTNFMCAELGVSTSGYHAWRGRAPSARQVADEALLAEIHTAHRDLDGNPGVRRTWAHLTASGWRIGHKRVHRLMRAAELQGRHPKAWKITTVAGETPVNGRLPARLLPGQRSPLRPLPAGSAWQSAVKRWGARCACGGRWRAR